MITLPEFRFVCTPRTGSRTLATALEPFGDRTRAHHNRIRDIPRDRPIYTVAREPLDQLESWYFHVFPPKGNWSSWSRWYPEGASFEDFLRYWTNDFLFPDLNPYKGIADKVFLFSDGMESVLAQMGYPKSVGHDGGQRTLNHDWTEVELELAEDRFSVDIEYYRKLNGGSH